MSLATGLHVVISDAGVAGCATAYYLAKDGVKDTILDRDSVGSHASGLYPGRSQPTGQRGHTRTA